MLVHYEVTHHQLNDVVDVADGHFVTVHDIQMVPGNAARSAGLFATVKLSSKLYLPSFQKHYEGFVSVSSLDDAYKEHWGITLTHCQSPNLPGMFKFDIINHYSYPGLGFAILHHHGIFLAEEDWLLAADFMLGEVILSPPIPADEVAKLLERSKAVAKLLMKLIGEPLRP